MNPGPAPVILASLNQSDIKWSVFIPNFFKVGTITTISTGIETGLCPKYDPTTPQGRISIKNPPSREVFGWSKGNG
ncbi:hypothetical protein D3C75_672760 [compost metagenome]